MNAPTPQTAAIQTPDAFAAWQLGLLDLSRVRRALDAGCGRGRLATALRARLAPLARLVLIDVARSAVGRARAAAAGRTAGAHASVEALPFAAEAFDLVLAGHLLPSVGNIGRAVRELRRVLRRDGTLLVGANSAASGRRMLELHQEACRRAGLPAMAQHAVAPTAGARFTLENGAGSLVPVFTHVEVYARDDALVFDSVAAALDVYLDGLHTRGARRLRTQADVTALAERLGPPMEAVLREVLAREGRIAIPRRAGCFVARP